MSTGVFMHPADIASALKKSGRTKVSLARELGIGQVAVGEVINGKARSARIETTISDKLGLPLHVLWPQYYSAPVGSAAPTPAPKAPAVDPLGELMMREWRRLDMANKARLLEIVAEMNQGIEKLMADAANAPKRALAEATAELTKTIEDVANAPQRALEKLASETGIQIDRNFGQVNKGGKNTFNKF